MLDYIGRTYSQGIGKIEAIDENICKLLLGPVATGDVFGVSTRPLKGLEQFSGPNRHGDGKVFG